MLAISVDAEATSLADCTTLHIVLRTFSIKALNGRAASANSSPVSSGSRLVRSPPPTDIDTRQFFIALVRLMIARANTNAMIEPSTAITALAAISALF